MFNGTSSSKKSFPQGESSDAKISDMLQLYKPVASVRDMKTSYMYINVVAGVSSIDPLRLIQPTSRFFPNLVNGFRWSNPIDTFYPYLDPPPGNPADDPFNRDQVSVGKKWYAPIGTERRFNIRGLISELTDLRVPRDKIVIEINLAECQIESDPTNWVSIPDKVFHFRWNVLDFLNPGLEIRNTYKRDQIYSQLTPIPPPATPKPPEFADMYVTQILPRVTQATKQYQPETLYVRIKELSNGQPYNWTVTNSGQYSVDKNHQVLLKYGDMPVEDLTLEFGHMVFGGADNDAIKLLTDDRITTVETNIESYGQLALANPYSLNNLAFSPEPYPPLPGTTIEYWRNNIKGDNNNINPTQGVTNFDQNYTYLDYNREYYNTVCIDEKLRYDENGGLAALQGFTDHNYIDQYRGVKAGEKTIIVPADRPPYTFPQALVDGGTNVQLPFENGDTDPFLEQGMPLKYSQQVRNISFRLAIKVISMF